MMVEAGLGYAFTFNNLVYTGDDSALTYRPLRPAVKVSLFLVWKKYQTFTKAGEAFLKQVQESLKE